MSKYNSLDEIREALTTNPLPINSKVLSDEEKEKYYIMLQDIFDSISFNGQISFRDFELELGNSFTDIFEDKRVTKIIMDFFSRYASEIESAINNGYPISHELCSIINEMIPNELPQYEQLFKTIIEKNSDLLMNYKGRNPDYYIEMLNRGMSHSSIMDIITKSSYIFGDSFNDIIKTLVTYDPNFAKYYKGDMFKIIDVLIENNIFQKDIINSLQEKNNSFTVLLVGRLRKATDFPASDDFVDLFNSLYQNNNVTNEEYETVFKIILQKDPSKIDRYMGKSLSQNLMDFISGKIPVSMELVGELNRIPSRNISASLYNAIYEKMIEQNFELVGHYYGTNAKIYQRAMENGFDVDYRTLVNALTNKDMDEENAILIFNMLGVKPFDFNALNGYQFDRYALIKSFDKLEYFLSLVNIDREVFIQYAFSSSFNWLDSINKMIENNELENFINIKNYLFSNYYSSKTETSGVSNIVNMIDLMKNYQRYPELCSMILSQGLTEEEKNKLKLLFSTADVVKNDQGETIKNKEDLTNVEQLMFNNYRKQFTMAVNSSDKYQIKNVLCQLLFNMTLEEVIQKLETYGNVQDMRQLLFNNRNNKEITDNILEMMIYVSMMEEIVNFDDKDYLVQMASKILNENQEVYTLCQKCNILFKNFDEKMSQMYKDEMVVNLTNLGEVSEELIDKRLTEKTGIEVIDLMDRKYCLLEHVKSEREPLDSLLTGKATGKQIFISLSLGSHRNQSLYYGGRNEIIFGCDSIEPDRIIKSSISNMSSNSSIRSNSVEVSDRLFRSAQRGSLDTSAAINGHNSEILCYREGLKFQYIVLPDGREPTKEEIEIAKQYGLKFIKVQRLNNSIENPKEIEKSEKKEVEEHLPTYRPNSELSDLRKMFSVKKNDGLKRVAIFSDSHGLFEPTLAILEDAKKQGVDEIVSLGDNIGTGPNPSEVMDLLNEYGVISLKGNHEIYASGGIDALKEHLQKTRAYNEALRNSQWTGLQLTKEQMEKIKQLPQSMDIEIGGKKVRLAHYNKDYNTGEELSVPEDVDRVFQGHIHFASKGDSTYTVRGAGIGGEVGTAYYVILVEKPEGGYEIEERVVPYDIKSTRYDILESSMDEVDKNKMNTWIGGRQK